MARSPCTAPRASHGIADPAQRMPCETLLEGISPCTSKCGFDGPSIDYEDAPCAGADGRFGAEEHSESELQEAAAA